MQAFINLLRKLVARESYHPVLTYPWFVIKVMICRWRYAKTLKRIREKVSRGDKVRVIFLCMDTAKWKCQSIYNEMAKNTLFEPMVALTMTEEDEHHSNEEINMRNDKAKVYFEKHDCKVVLACDCTKGDVLPLDRLNADIVFFQVPWGNLPGQRVWDVSRYALTCNMPYSVEFLEWHHHRSRFDFHHMANFHCLMWANFNWSEEFANLLRVGQFPWEWAGRQLGTGHSALDVYALESTRNKIPGSLVVYSPHFSFTWGTHAPIMNLSTFHWSGKPVLAYAKAHPEIKWAFKPHPKLRERLSEIGFMSKDEVDTYYAEWEKLGPVCYDGDYSELFFNSRAMITDCGSFLFEYMSVNKPLIRLIPDNTKVVPSKAARSVCDSFYNCHSLDEMYTAFEIVLEQGLDPKKEERNVACRAAKILGNYAAEKVLEIFKKEFCA